MIPADDPLHFMRPLIQLALNGVARRLEELARDTSDPDTENQLMQLAGELLRAAEVPDV